MRPAPGDRRNRTSCWPVTVCSGAALIPQAPPPSPAMAPQFTLQAPLKLPPYAVTDHLRQLWEHPEEGYNGSATFTLVVWEPAWLEQHLARLGLPAGCGHGHATPLPGGGGPARH